MVELSFVDDAEREKYKKAEDDEIKNAAKSTDERHDVDIDPIGKSVKKHLGDMIFDDPDRARRAYDKLSKSLEKGKVAGTISIHDCLHDEKETSWIPCTQSKYEETVV
jgi:NAD+--asparagine ADP-ribosyltransferase